MSDRLWSRSEEPGVAPGASVRPGPEHAPGPQDAPAPPAPVPNGMRAFCRACGRGLDPRAVICPACGVAQPPIAGAYAPVALPPEPKSAGVAMFLSFLWPGAGHLYLEDTGAKAIVFTVVSALCFLLSLSIIGLVISVPVWLGCAIYTMIDTSSATARFNARIRGG
jgi:hypothetical protein